MAQVSDLLRQLGYPVASGLVGKRLDNVMLSHGNHLWVWENAGVDGFIHFYDRPSLDKGKEMIVQALVVRASARRQGLGCELLAKAEEVARTSECASVSLYSSEQRLGAHRFYEGLGYRPMKSSILMRKTLMNPPEPLPD